MIKWESEGPILYWPNRVGRWNVIFRMPKFRTMQEGTPALAKHLPANLSCHLTAAGPFYENLA